MESSLNGKKLSAKFYSREVLTVAKELLGKIFVKHDGKVHYAAKIVEVEAYHGDFDEASHSFRGMTKRNEIMFNVGGYLYVYFTYGAHFCCNVVTGIMGQGTAVLIRAVEPLEGIKKMMINRFEKSKLSEKEFYNLTSGPGKVCKAMNINKSHTGTDLTGDRIFILNNTKIPESKIGISKRIGISRSVNLPWRFFIKDNPFLSRK